MKKILTVMFALIAFTMTASAQWSTKFHEGDELTGMEEYYSNIYVADAGAFVCWDNEDRVKIVADRGIFDYDDNYVSAIIGFYVDGKLAEKVTTKLYVPDGDADTAYTSDYRTKGLGLKIKDHLKNKGDVRIIASKYSGSDFDIMIPKYPELK